MVQFYNTLPKLIAFYYIKSSLLVTGKGRYGGIAIDYDGKIVASRSEQKGKNYVHVLSLTDTNVNNHIDSHDNKLKRPSGVAVTLGNHVIVVDLGNNCIKKYRYW